MSLPSRTKGLFWAAAMSAVVFYFVVVLTWFDHDLKTPLSGLSPLYPSSILLVCLAAVLFLRRAPRPFADGRDNRLVLGLGLVAMASRLPFLACAYGLFSSDAAVQGIMALHILEGKHHPVFLYRWSYIGSFKAHLTALLAWITGEPVLSFAGAAILLNGVFAGSVFALARTVLPRGEAVMAALYVIVSPAFLTAWGIHNEGSYLDVLALGTLVLFLGARLLAESEGRVGRAFWMGVIGGVAFWTHILATYYLLGALLALVAAEWSWRRLPARLGAFAGGFILGDLPGLLWNAAHEWQSFRWWTLDQTAISDRLGRAASQLGEVSTTSLAVLAGWWPADHPPWPGVFWRWALLGVIPVALVSFAVRARHGLRPLLRGRLTPETYLIGFALLVVAVFAQSSFGWLTEEPRYLLFLYSVVPLFVASAIGSVWRRRRLAAALLAAALLFVHVHGTAVYWWRALEGARVNRDFVRDLEVLGVRHGHTDYYISYKYNFLSHGRLVLTSALGPARTEWYLPYREEVGRADRVALIPRSFRLARRIGQRLQSRGVRYRREDLLYPVLFDLSEKVDPGSLP